MSEDARVENVERTRRRLIEALRTHEIVWVDVGCRYACGCDERGMLRLPTTDIALAHVTDNLLPIVEDHAKARYKAGAADALREAERLVRAEAERLWSAKDHMGRCGRDSPYADEANAVWDAAETIAVHIARIEAS